MRHWPGASGPEFYGATLHVYVLESHRTILQLLHGAFPGQKWRVKAMGCMMLHQFRSFLGIRHYWCLQELTNAHLCFVLLFVSLSLPLPIAKHILWLLYMYIYIYIYASPSLCVCQAAFWKADGYLNVLQRPKARNPELYKKATCLTVPGLARTHGSAPHQST